MTEHASPIHTFDVDGLHVVRIQAGKVNALDLDALTELRSAVTAFADDQTLVLTGTERVFSAGVDLARLLDEGPEYTSAYLTELEDLVQGLFQRSGPVVASLTGHAIAGGCLIAAACDYRVMGQGRIGVTEALVGLPIPPASLEALRHVVGSRTGSLVSTGKTLEPLAARAIGLVDEVVPPEDVLQRSLEVARAFSATPSQTYAHHKRMLRSEAIDRQNTARAEHSARTESIWLHAEPRTIARAYLEGLGQR